MPFPRKETKLSALRKNFKVKEDGKVLLNLKFQGKQNACLNCCLSKNTNASENDLEIYNIKSIYAIKTE